MTTTISNPLTVRWFYNSNTGLSVQGPIGEHPTEWVDSVNGHLFGWHEYNTRQDMLNDINAHIGWPQPVGGVTGEIGNVAKNAIGDTIGNAASGAGAAASKAFLGPLYQPNIWIRVGEVVLGLILIAVGLAKLTNAVPIATTVAKGVGAVALA